MFLTETWIPPNYNTTLTTLVYNVNVDNRNVLAGGRRFTGGLMCIANPQVKQSIQIIYQCPLAHYVLIRVQDLFIAHCYYPPSLDDDSVINSLEEILSKTGNDCIIVGDLNARIGSLVGDTSTNRRGSKLLSFLADTVLSVIPSSNLVPTSYSYGGSGVPDLVLGTGQSIDVEIIERETLGGSDHRPMILTIHDTSLNYTGFTRWNIRRLQDEDVRTKYQQALTNCKDSLIQNLEGADVEQSWALFKEWVEMAAGISCKRFKFKLDRKNDYWTPELETMKSNIENVVNEHQTLVNDRFISTQQKKAKYSELINLQRDYRAALTKRKDELFRDWCVKLGDPTNTPNAMKKIKALKARRSNKHCALDSTKINEHVQYFKETFGGLPTGTIGYNDHLAQRTIQQDQQVISHSIPEVTRARKLLPRGKAGGSDEILAEFILEAPPDIMDEVLCKLFNVISSRNTIPQDWKIALVLPVYKGKGGTDDIKNHRPISLTSVVRRMYEKLIYQKLETYTHKLSQFQGGFRAKRSTLDQAFILNELILNHSRLQNIFLDFKAAYDLVDRRILWTSLLMKYEIPIPVIKILQTLFDDNQSQLIIAGVRSQPMRNLRGLLQGSSLSPILFNFFLDSLLKELDAATGLKTATYTIHTNHLAFADDINIHSTDINKLKQLLAMCESWSIKVGMRFSPTKCIALVDQISPRGSTFTIYGTPITEATSAKYLGIIFNSKGIDWSGQLESTRPKVITTLQIFKAMGYNLTGFDQTTSINIYLTFLRPMLEYGVALCPSREALTKYQYVQNMCLGAMFSSPRKTSISALHKLTLIEPFDCRVAILGCKYWARLWNTNDGNIPAVKFAWKSTVYSRLKNILSKKIAKHPFWSHARKLDHLTNHLTTRSTPIQAKTAFTKAQTLKLRAKAILQLDPEATNIGGCIKLDQNEPLKHWKILKASTFTSNSDRINILRWALGNVVRHEICKNCTGTGDEPNELSRAHAIDCALSEEETDAILEISELTESDHPELNILSRAIWKTRYTIQQHQIVATSQAITKIYRRCLGFHQKSNGYWQAPEMEDSDRRTDSQETSTNGIVNPTIDPALPILTPPQVSRHPEPSKPVASGISNRQTQLQTAASSFFAKKKAKQGKDPDSGHGDATLPPP